MAGFAGTDGRRNVRNFFQVPSDTLRGELEKHNAWLKQELVDLINRDYDDFLSLSSGLNDLDAYIDQMSSPIAELEQKVGVVKAAVQDELDAVLLGVQRKEEAIKEREQLELMQDTMNVVTKLERLLVEDEADGAGSAPASPSGGAVGKKGGKQSLKQRSQVLDRIAAEASRLQFYMAKGAALPVMQKMRDRIRSVEAHLHQSLNHVLSLAISERDTPSIKRCLRAYVAAGAPRIAEELIRSVVIAPAVAAEVAKAPADDPMLKPLLDGFLQAVRRDCMFLIELVNQLESARRDAFNLPAVILREVDAAIAAARPGAYSPGVPHAFRLNYLASMAFADTLAQLFQSDAAAATFRGSEAHAAYVKRWNLSVYFSLHFQEMAAAFEECLQGGLRPAGEGSEFLLGTSEGLWAHLQKAVSPDVFLAKLADKFLKLSLQVLARYAAWLQEGEEGAGWAAGAGDDDLYKAYVDAGRVARKLRGEYADLWATTVEATVGGAGGGGDLRGLIAAALEEQVQVLQRVQGAMVAKISASVADACKDSLKFVRGIIATYRMTNKPMPTQASLYVGSILAPLQTFLDQREATLDPEFRLELAKSTAAALTDKFREVAEDLLKTVKQTDATLKRLKQKQKTAGGDGGVSDADKIRAQLLLDVQAYGGLLRALGVPIAAGEPERFESFHALWRAVAPEGREPELELGAPAPGAAEEGSERE